MIWACLAALLALSCAPEDPEVSRFRGGRYAPVAALDRTLHPIFGSGQSNMLGLGASPPAVTDPASIPYYIWNQAGYQSTVLEPLAALAGTHGVELTMAPALRAAGAKTAVYKHTRTGASISHWLPAGSPEVYTEMIARIPAVTAMLRARHRGPIQWDIVWIQGESDAQPDVVSPAPYASALRSLLALLRDPTLLGPSARAHIVALHPDFPLTETAIGHIRTAQLDVSGDAGNFYIEVDDIPVSDIHYDSTGLNTLGARIAESLLEGM